MTPQFNFCPNPSRIESPLCAAVRLRRCLLHNPPCTLTPAKKPEVQDQPPPERIARSISTQNHGTPCPSPSRTSADGHRLPVSEVCCRHPVENLPSFCAAAPPTSFLLAASVLLLLAASTSLRPFLSSPPWLSPPTGCLFTTSLPSRAFLLPPSCLLTGALFFMFQVIVHHTMSPKLSP